MKRFTLVMACLLVLGACGGRNEIYDEGARPPDAAERGVTLPDPVPASAAYAITLKKSLPEKAVKKLEDTKGVAVVAPIAIARVKVKGPKGTEKLRVGEMQPLDFRSVAPAATRDAEFVWVSLIVGQAVPTFDAGRKLGVTGGGEIQIDGTKVKVGAIADNGVPNFADVLVQSNRERSHGIGAPRFYVIGAKSGTTIETLGKALKKELPKSAKLRRIIPDDTAPAVPQANAAAAPQPVGHVSGGVVGSMSFQILPSGFIRPDPAWVAANITQGSVPILGTVTCHRLMIPRLAGALGDVVDAGLANEIRPGDYGGCYVPRFIDRDPTKPLSNHAFGLAVDLNVSTNGLGTRGDMHPDVVRIFQGWGFNWGGVWSRPDPMHFELTG